MPVLEHRDPELAALDAVLAAASAGNGGAALLTGDAGTGKTTLLDAVREQATEHGLRVLRARGSEIDRQHAFGTVQSLLERAVREAGDDVWEGSAALARPVFEPAPSGPTGSTGSTGPIEDVDGAAFARRQGLYWLVVGLAEALGPLALVVDDAHWADEASVELLFHLASRLEGLPVAVVAATRPLASVPPEAALHELAVESTVVAVGPLAPGATAALVVEALGDDSLAQACHAATGGNPLLLHELLLDLASRDHRPSATSIGTVGVRTIGLRVQRELRRASAGAVSLARAVAVFGDDVAVDDAVDLAALDRDEADRALLGLREAAMLTTAPDGRLRFVHPVVRSSVHDAIAVLERRDLHAWAARRLHDRHAPAARVAAHLLEAGRVEEPWAVDTLRTAATQALDLGQPAEAVRYLRRAHEGSPAADPGLLASLARAEAAAGESAALDHFVLALQAHDDPEERLRLARDHAGALSMGAQADAAFASVDRVRRQLADRLPPAQQLAARAAAHALALWSRSPEATRLREDHLARFDADPGWLDQDADAGRQLAAVIAYEHAIRGRPADPHLLARVADGGFVADLGSSPSWGYGVWALVMADRHAEALAEVDRVGASARSTGAAVVGALTDCLRALVHLRRGDLLAAEADAVQSLALASQPSWRLGRIACSAFLADTLLAQGRPADARAALDAVPAADLGGDSNLEDLFMAARARLAIAGGRPAEALPELERLGARLEDNGWRSPAFVPWRSLAATAHAALGEHDRAADLVAHDVAAAEAADARGALAQARLTAALVRRRLDAEELAAVADLASGAGAGLVHAEALVARGRALRVASQPSAAREPLRAGLAHAQRCGARGLAATALDELVASGARPRRVRVQGTDALTASEARVASLAAEGSTNREIAQRLYVTQKTVEMHLRNAYRKLDVGSRAQLPGVLAAAGS